MALSGPESSPFPFQTMKPIRFNLERHYGLTRAYPIDQEAILLTRLSKTKTLLPGDLGTIAGLGFVCVDQQGREIKPSELY